MQFDIITIFPSIFSSYLEESLIKTACKKKYIKINIHNLRDYALDKHKTVDDTPFGGGTGMVMKVEPIKLAIDKINDKSKKTKVILFTPRGKRFNQKKATEFANFEQIIMICGRYEGVDERVLKYVADEGISIGSYVLMGGEVPAMIVLESVSRLLEGVVGKESFLKERKNSDSFLEYPQYTKPKDVMISNKKRGVPAVLVSGDHKKIKSWREKNKKIVK